MNAPTHPSSLSRKGTHARSARLWPALAWSMLAILALAVGFIVGSSAKQGSQYHAASSRLAPALPGGGTSTPTVPALRATVALPALRSRPRQHANAPTAAGGSTSVGTATTAPAPVPSSAPTPSVSSTPAPPKHSAPPSSGGRVRQESGGGA